MTLLKPLVFENVVTKLINSKGLFLLINQEYLCRINMTFYNRYMAQSTPLSLHLYTTGKAMKGELKSHYFSSGEITVWKVDPIDLMQMVADIDKNTT